LLGLRRFRKVQIDIWQGQASQFTADCLVAFDVGTSSKIRLEKSDQATAYTMHVRVPWTADASADTSGLETTFQQIFQEVEQAGLRHLVIQGPPGNSQKVEVWKSLAKAGFRSLHHWLESDRPTQLGRVTFIADSANGYDILQEHLFAEYADELDDQGF
jgi:hypothetical protein